MLRDQACNSTTMAEWASSQWWPPRWKAQPFAKNLADAKEGRLCWKGGSEERAAKLAAKAAATEAEHPKKCKGVHNVINQTIKKQLFQNSWGIEAAAR